MNEPQTTNEELERHRSLSKAIEEAARAFGSIKMALGALYRLFGHYSWRLSWLQEHELDVIRDMMKDQEKKLDSALRRIERFRD